MGTEVSLISKLLQPKQRVYFLDLDNVHLQYLLDCHFGIDFDFYFNFFNNSLQILAIEFPLN